MATSTTRESGTLSAELGLGEKMKMLRGIYDPKYFNEKVRPLLYEKAGCDPEAVHTLALEILKKNSSSISTIAPLLFKQNERLLIPINGKNIFPFGSAAGMDKNGDAFKAFEHVFGFQEPGTIVIPQRPGNKPVRVAALNEQLDLLNAQGFPSKGLDNFTTNISNYRSAGGKATIYASICGLPLSETNAVETALKEMEIIMERLMPFVDGFVWNPFSPNTDALKKLRTESVFFETAQMMIGTAPLKPRLVKIGPYEPAEWHSTMSLIDYFISGGGHGVVTPNTKMFKKEELPESVRETWGHSGAGRSGKFLQSYRMRSVQDIRFEFPKSIIIATGGIYTGDDAYNTLRSGANMLEGYTPYTFYGLGLLRKIQNRVVERMEMDGFKTLKEMQESYWG